MCAWLDTLFSFNSIIYCNLWRYWFNFCMLNMKEFENIYLPVSLNKFNVPHPHVIQQFILICRNDPVFIRAYKSWWYLGNYRTVSNWISNAASRASITCGGINTVLLTNVHFAFARNTIMTYYIKMHAWNSEPKISFWDNCVINSILFIL